MSEETDSGILTLATQGGITFFGNIVGKVLRFLFVAVATRLVTPAEYGVFTLALSIVMFAQGFAGLNIYRSLDYFIPQFLADSNYAKAKKTLLNVFLIGFLTSSIGAIAVYLGRNQIEALFNEPRLLIALTPFILLIPLQTLNRTLLASFNSIKKLKYRVLVQDILNPLVRIFGAIAFVVSGAGLLGLVGGYLLGMTVAVLFGVSFLLYEADWVRTPTTEQVSNRSLLSYSLPLVLAGVIYALVGQIDYFVIGYFGIPSEVGQYRVAFLLAMNLLIVLSALTPVFKPMVAENQSNDRVLQSRYQLTTRWITIFTLPLAITLILASDVYLRLLFTEAYTAASSAVVVLSIGYLLNASFGPEGMVLEGLGHTRLTLLNTFILVGTNGILDVLLVPRFGIVGAGIATGTALTVTGFLGVLEIYYLRDIVPLDGKLVRVWLAALFPIVFGWYFVFVMVSSPLIAIFLPLVVVLSNIVGLRVFKGFSEDDLQVANQIDSRIGYPLIRRVIGF